MPDSLHPAHAVSVPVDSTADSAQTDVPLATHIPVDHHDPFSDKPSFHPVGTTVGAATGAAAGVLVGAVIGSTGGPVGAALGATAGAIAAAFAGGSAGRHIAEHLSPSTEDHHWRACYFRQPYIPPGTPYETFRPAYYFGAHMRKVHSDKTWDQAESAIRAAWEQSADAPALPWSVAEPAIHDAWDRLTPRDPDL